MPTTREDDGVSETASQSRAHTEHRTVRLADGTLELSWAAITDTGRRREINQDAMLADYPLFIVADGMGGHIGGEIASASVIGRLGPLASTRDVNPKTIEKALSRAVKDIIAHPETTDEGTGTTVTAAVAVSMPSEVV